YLRYILREEILVQNLRHERGPSPRLSLYRIEIYIQLSRPPTIAFSRSSSKLFHMRLFIPILLLAITTLAPSLALADPPPYQDICEVDLNYLCTSKGKKAYVKSGRDKTSLGKIV